MENRRPYSASRPDPGPVVAAVLKRNHSRPPAGRQSQPMPYPSLLPSENATIAEPADGERTTPTPYPPLLPDSNATTSGQRPQDKVNQRRTRNRRRRRMHRWQRGC